MNDRRWWMVPFLLTLLTLGGCEREPASDDWGHWMADARHHGPMMDAMMHDEEFMDQWAARMAADPNAAQRMMGSMMHDSDTMDVMMDEIVSDPELRDEMLRHMRDHEDQWNDVMMELSRDERWCEELVARCAQRPASE